jgi:hypothetical protein
MDNGVIERLLAGIEVKGAKKRGGVRSDPWRE